MMIKLKLINYRDLKIVFVQESFILLSRPYVYQIFLVGDRTVFFQYDLEISFLFKTSKHFSFFEQIRD